MLSRIKSSVAMGMGNFHLWKDKNINIKLSLGEKIKRRFNGYHGIEIGKGSLTTKKVARKGLILGLTTCRLYFHRIDRSFKPKIHLKTAYSDIIFDDTYWKTRRIFRKEKIRKRNKVKRLYRILRETFIKIIKKRVYILFSNYLNLKKHEMKYTLYLSTGGFRSATATANFLARKLILKFNVWESTLPLIRRLRRRVAGIFVVC